MRDVADSLGGIYYSIDLIGEKLHRKIFQEVFPMRAIAVSMDDIYFLIYPIGDKLHRKKSKGIPFEVHI